MTYLHDGHQHDTVGDTGVNTLVVVGGVAANSELRRFIHISTAYVYCDLFYYRGILLTGE
jgi:tRNA A37 threonylcarbamoyltransferase TsaD